MFLRINRNLTSFDYLRVIAAQELLAPLLEHALFLGCTVLTFVLSKQKSVLLAIEIKLTLLASIYNLLKLRTMCFSFWNGFKTFKVAVSTGVSSPDFQLCTVLCKKNANEFRRISVIVLSKFRRNFGGKGVIFRPKFRRNFAEPHENSNAGRKFANPATKFRLEFVRNETKIRKSSNEISVFCSRR